MATAKKFNLQEEYVDKYTEFFKKVMKFNQLLLSPPDIKTGQTPCEVVYRKHKIKLIRYRPVADNLYRTPVVIAYALINKPYIMDLLPGRSVVEILIKSGFDVYLIDWGSPTDSDRHNDLNRYINFYMDRMVDKTLELSGAEKTSLLGYCMGGTMSLMYTALHQEKIENLITMTTPFDCSKNEGLLFKWSKEFPAHEVEKIYGNCPGWLLGSSFALLKPMGPLDKAYGLFQGVLDDRYVELFIAMEKWLFDTIDLSGRVYTEVLRDWFQENLLIKNQIILGDDKVDFRKITCPYLNLVAEEDTSIPPSSSVMIGDYISSKDKELLTAPVGHIGLSVSGKSLKKLWPKVAEWLSERSGKMISLKTG